MKARIFIGSSTEGLPVAQRIKEYFEPDYDCYIWNDGIFKYNEGFLETLIKSASLFDFGFMVFAADDVSRIRDKEYITTRDNVLFEYGLFLGRVGLDKAYIIKDKEVKIPSDMLGITLLEYETTANDDGYKVPNDDFENFIKLLTDEIMRQGESIKIGDNTYKSARIRVVIPKTLDADMKRQATIYFKKINFKSCPINTVHRTYPIFVESTPADEHKDEAIIADLPTILNGIDQAIDMYFCTGHIGKSQEQQLTEERELNNFTRVLKLLISRDAYCREIVEIVDEENNPIV